MEAHFSIRRVSLFFHFQDHHPMFAYTFTLCASLGWYKLHYEAVHTLCEMPGTYLDMLRNVTRDCSVKSGEDSGKRGM